MMDCGWSAGEDDKCGPLTPPPPCNCRIITPSVWHCLDLRAPRRLIFGHAALPSAGLAIEAIRGLPLMFLISEAASTRSIFTHLRETPCLRSPSICTVSNGAVGHVA